MPIALSPAEERPLPKWERPAKTKEDLHWAEIKVLDLSTFDTPGGKQKLAEELREAVITNAGIPTDPARVQRQYDIGQAFFALPHAEKSQPAYKCDFASGNYFGYRELHERTVKGTDVRDNVESYNHAKFTEHYEREPRHPFFEPYRGEMEVFSRQALEVAQKIFQLFALILELPEDYFASKHRYDDPSDDHLRYMCYHPRPREEDARVDNTWARAHTDFGSLTLLWSQNVAGLQIKTTAADGSGEWRYVPPVDGGIVCNVGDTLDFWSASYLKSTTHRVVRPPEDQLGGNRLGLFYFVRPGNEVDIKPAPSPLLKRLGLVDEKQQDAAPVKGLEYVRTRVKDYHNTSDYEDRKGKTFKVGNLEIVDEAA
ncbi:2OG-Fe(II) oxygenase superfamily protein [Coniella lustricola]|uniref:2OG-Fe(II) oxygenase superfamily protein n=1 Tax=Coniella lustricola TaxID=2025994 RepID=A0A2T3AGV8_9PEZI|nr:2OG-Fe(II) oxygenase superfamily protein [Coniella lustricola]